MAKKIKIKVPADVSVDLTIKKEPCDKEFNMEDYVMDLNESVKFVTKADMIISVTKCRDWGPVRMRLERVFRHGKAEFKNVDRDKGLTF